MIRSSTGELKPKQEQDQIDNKESEANAQALFSIFNEVSLDGFHKIATCKCAKEA